MTSREFETKYNVNLADVFKSKETRGGVDFYTVPVSTSIAVNSDGYRFAILKPYKRAKWREKAIDWALEQFEKDTLKPLENLRWT